MVKLTSLVLFLAGLTLMAGCVSASSDESHERNEIREMEVAQLIGELRFMNGAELVEAANRLAFMRDFAYPQLREALKSDDAHTRANVIYVFGLAGDRRNIDFIRPLLEDQAVVVRYEAAATLVDMGDPAGFPTLIEGLTDDNIRWRFKCLEALRTVTGQDFGYKHDDDPALRRAAVERWRGWLQEKRASAL